MGLLSTLVTATLAPACADRSGGPPKPGTPMKVSRTEPPAGRRAAVGARRGPGGPWRRPGVPRGSEHQTVHQYEAVERPVG